MSIAGDAPEPDFYFEGGPSPFRTFDLLPRGRRDRGGYQLSTWWNEEDKDGNFFVVKRARGKEAYSMRILQPNPNGMMWKKFVDGEYHFETYGDLMKMAERQRAQIEQQKK